LSFRLVEKLAHRPQILDVAAAINAVDKMTQ
jgi:hypothetical protein